MGGDLKVLWVSHLVPWPPKGGVLMRSNYLASELARRHHVDLLALNQPRLLGAYFDSVEEGLAAARAALSRDFREVTFVEPDIVPGPGQREWLALKCLLTPDPYSVAWLRSRSLAEQIQRALASREYDVVHFDTVGLARYRGLAGRLPTVLDHHNIESHMMLRRAEREKNLLKKTYFYQEGYRLRRFEKQILSAFDGHITCSETDSDRLRQLAENLHVRAIPNSVRVDRGFERNARGSGIGRLVFIGGLDWYPNRDAMIHFLEEVWPLLRSRTGRVVVDIVGKNPDEHLRRLVAGDPQVRLHGFVDDIKSFYRNSDVFICPIRDGGGTKLKVLDAMAHAMPVIGYPEACEGIDVVDGRHALVAHSPAEFASRLETLLTDPEQLRQLGSNAQELILQRYEATKVGADLCSFYEELAQGGRSATVAGKAVA